MNALIGPLTTSAAVLAAFAFLALRPDLDPALAAPATHFYLVSAIAFIATAMAVVIGEAGRRLRNVQVVFLSMAFVSLGGFFLLHGLATPGFLISPSRLPPIAAQLSHSFLAFWIVVATYSPSSAWRRPLRVPASALLAGWTAVVLATVATGLLAPSLVAAAPVDRAPLKWLVALVTVAMAGVAGWRFAKAYRFTRLPLQRLMVYAAAWVATSQVISAFGRVWNVSWWTYHVLLLAAVVVLAVGLWQQYATRGIRNSLQALFAADPEERIEAGLSASVRALVVATEAKDRYTAGHNQRVAHNAVRIGERLGLRPEALRALAQGGMVHDLGKLEIPDAVLNKPGKLTDDEFAVVRRHPVTGYEMAARLGMMPDELDVIRHHHERWDGRGYPDGLTGEEIPLLARIVAVADVYDALTSERSYRAAWTAEEADRHLEREAGAAFDPRCVQAWLELQSRAVEAPVEVEPRPA